ncbi:MAG: M24 family metallopeptidase [Candidatus Aenigmatarchaeota archaeon]
MKFVELPVEEQVKDEKELDIMRRISEETVEVLENIHSDLKRFSHRDEIVRELSDRINERGMETAFEPYVILNERTASPKPQQYGEEIVQGPMLIDMGLKDEGLNSDMTRMFFFGEPSREMRSRYEKLVECQKELISKVRDGVKYRELDETAEEFLSNSEGEYIRGRLGHGIGENVNESPSCRGEDILREGMVITREPGLYFEDYGFRVEDMVLVHENSSEILTDYTKDMQDLTVPYSQ